MKTTRLVFFLRLLVDLNSQPTTGMSPRIGTLVTLSVSSSLIKPPITAVSPLSTTTLVLIWRVVVEMAFGTKEHFTAEALLARSRRRDAKVSRATVYRTLPLLVGCGAVREVDVGRDHTYYLTESGGANFRAQLICERCEAIVPVDAPFMEWYGKAVAAKHGMRPVSQRLQVNAICAACQRREAKP